MTVFSSSWGLIRAWTNQQYCTGLYGINQPSSITFTWDNWVSNQKHDGWALQLSYSSYLGNRRYAVGDPPCRHNVKKIFQFVYEHGPWYWQHSILYTSTTSNLNALYLKKMVFLDTAENCHYNMLHFWKLTLCITVACRKVTGSQAPA